MSFAKDWATYKSIQQVTSSQVYCSFLFYRIINGLVIQNKGTNIWMMRFKITYFEVFEKLLQFLNQNPNTHSYLVVISENIDS
jgi:hypothetical protein